MIKLIVLPKENIVIVNKFSNSTLVCSRCEYVVGLVESVGLVAGLVVGLATGLVVVMVVMVVGL
jgi:hypothetical protein